MILIAINITAFICLFVTTELTYLLITSFASFTSLIVSNVFLVNETCWQPNNSLYNPDEGAVLSCLSTCTEPVS